jgi:hypothetical protein
MESTIFKVFTKHIHIHGFRCGVVAPHLLLAWAPSHLSQNLVEIRAPNISKPLLRRSAYGELSFALVRVYILSALIFTPQI